MQIPIGEEEKFEGVIDLLKMKAYYFEGEKGEDVPQGEIPEQYLDRMPRNIAPNWWKKLPSMTTSSRPIFSKGKKFHLKY